MTTSSRRFPAILFSAWALVAGMIACGKDSAPTQDEMVKPTFSGIQAQVFDRSCALPSCHSSAGQRGGLILEAGKSYTNLVNVRSVNDAARARGFLRVIPFKPDSSFLCIKIMGPGAGEGSLMPDGLGRLSQESIDVIREWVALGALNN
jgi:hypothetical protein